MIRIAGMDDPDDPIVWERQGQRMRIVAGKPVLEWRHLFITKSACDQSIKIMGIEAFNKWLEGEKIRAEAEIVAFENGCEGTIQ